MVHHEWDGCSRATKDAGALELARVRLGLSVRVFLR